MGFPYSFGFGDSLVAEVGGITMSQLHFDAKAISHAFECMKPLADRLGVAAPAPKMAGFGYPHMAALGAEVVFPEDSEPKPLPLLQEARDIDHLKEPDDYLAARLIRRKLAVLEELKKYRPDVPLSIGHNMEGPVTTAVLLMGQDFFMLPYDDPQRAHRLLEFCTESALNYTEAISAYFGHTIASGPKGMPDDFAGMVPPALFEEFVLPYWERTYEGLQATERNLHSELLKKEHLPFLDQLRIKCFDPSADQYLNGHILAQHCPCDFTLRILSWHVRDLSSDQLRDLYVELHSYNPVSVSFHMCFMTEEDKIKRLLQTAERMEAKTRSKET